jgi:hypothetical protein
MACSHWRRSSASPKPAARRRLRAWWTLLPTAFAIDSVALEVLFTAGPLLAAGIIAVASPLAALVVSAGCSLIGTLAFVAQRPSQAWRPDPDAGARGRLGALSSLRTLAFAALPGGFCFGAVARCSCARP